MTTPLNFKPFADSSYGTSSGGTGTSTNTNTGTSSEPLRRRNDGFSHAQSSFDDFPYAPYSDLPFTSLKRRKQGNSFVKWTMRTVLASPVVVLVVWSIGALLFTSKQAAGTRSSTRQHKQPKNARRLPNVNTNPLGATGASRPGLYMNMQPYGQAAPQQQQQQQPPNPYAAGYLVGGNGYMAVPQNQVNPYMTPAQPNQFGYMTVPQNQANENYRMQQDPSMGVSQTMVNPEQYMQPQAQPQPNNNNNDQQQPMMATGDGKRIPVYGPLGSSNVSGQPPPPAGATTSQGQVPRMRQAEQPLAFGQSEQPPVLSLQANQNQPMMSTNGMMSVTGPLGSPNKIVLQPHAGASQGQAPMMGQAEQPPLMAQAQEQPPVMAQVDPDPLLTQEPPILGSAHDDSPTMGDPRTGLRPPPMPRSTNKQQQVYYYDPKLAMADGELKIPTVVYDQQGNQIELQALQGAQIFLEPPQQQQQVESPKQQLAGGQSLSKWGESTAQDQSIIVSTVAVMALLVGALSARRMRSRSFLSSCIENESLEDDVAYDTAYTTNADNSYNTFGGWKGDLEKFDV
jgi:hypothetical protein